MSGHTPWAEVKRQASPIYTIALSGTRATRPHLTTGPVGSQIRAVCGKKPGGAGWLGAPDDAKLCRRCARLARRWGG